jgi:hypothetical protein
VQTNTRRIYLVLVFTTLFSLSTQCSAAQDQTQENAQVSNSVAQPIRAVGLSKEIAKSQVLVKSFDLAKAPFFKQVEAILSSDKCLLPRQALIVHVAQWGMNKTTASLQLLASDWNVYRGSSHKGTCTLALVPLRTDDGGNDYPLLYGVKSTIFVGINTFNQVDANGHFVTTEEKDDKGQTITKNVPSPVAVNIAYTASTTKAVAENVQNFGMLISAVLGVSKTGGGEAKPYPSYIGAGLIPGYKTLPFAINIGYSLTLPTPPASQESQDAQKSGDKSAISQPVPLTAAYAGIPYSQALPFEGGVGEKTFHLLAGNQPPPSFTVDSTGRLSGIGTNTATTQFIVDVTDSAVPPHTVRMRYLFRILPASDQPTDLAGGAPSPQPAKPATPTKGDTSTGDKVNSNQQSSDVVDCSAVSEKTPCTFKQSLKSEDREPFDFSLAVPIPGVRETKYTISGSAVKSSVTTHVDLYAMVDLYPAFWKKDKRSWAPHLAVGIPVAGQTFYRPFYGAAENFTNWTGLRRLGFPLEMSFFAGVVDMKVQYPVTVSNGSPVLHSTRILKSLFGVELSVGSLVGKIGGSKSKSK